MFAEAVTRIWIEPLRHPDGLPRYNSRGQLYRARLGGPGGDVLVEQTVSPMCPSCRALMARGITGLFETWKEGVPYACMRGDIEKMAGLTVYEPDDGVVQFARWRPFDQNTVSRSAASAPARNDDRAVRGKYLPTRARVVEQEGSCWPKLRNESRSAPQASKRI